jgi:hypothetical protein
MSLIGLYIPGGGYDQGPASFLKALPETGISFPGTEEVRGVNLLPRQVHKRAFTLLIRWGYLPNGTIHIDYILHREARRLLIPIGLRR